MTIDEFNTLYVRLNVGGHEVQLWPSIWLPLLVGVVVVVAILAVSMLTVWLSFRKRD